MAGTLAAPSPPKSYLALQSSPVTLAWTSGTGPGRIMAALLEHRHGTNPTLHTTSSRDTRSLAVGANCPVCSTHSQCTQLEPERAEGPMDLWWSTPPLLHPLAAAVPSSNQQHRSQAVKDGVVSTCGSARKAPHYLRPASEGCSLAAHAQYCTVL